MKMRLLSIVALAGLFIFSACKREDDTPSEPTNEEQISGVWNLDDVSASGVIAVAGQSIPFVTTGATVDPDSYFDFNTSPEQTVDYDASATLDVSAGQNFQFPYQQSGTGTWELKGRDSLIVTEDNRTSRYYILSWTDSRMILRSNEQITFAGQDINATVEATIVR